MACQAATSPAPSSSGRTTAISTMPLPQLADLLLNPLAQLAYGGPDHVPDHDDERERVVPGQPGELGRVMRRPGRAGPGHVLVEPPVGELGRDIGVLDDDPPAIHLPARRNLSPGQIKMLGAHHIDPG